MTPSRAQWLRLPLRCPRGSICRLYAVHVMWGGAGSESGATHIAAAAEVRVQVSMEPSPSLEGDWHTVATQQHAARHAKVCGSRFGGGLVVKRLRPAVG